MKQVMAITGLAWSFFVLTHMAGNLLIFCGADTYNKYGHAIISNPFLVAAEVGLVMMLLGHVLWGAMVTRQNKGARKSKYVSGTNGEKAPRFQSKWMAYHGSLILVFIILHLITFKYGTVYMTRVDGVEMRDLYRLMHEVFQQPIYVVWYVIALLLVGMHLSHGLYSSFASLGFYHPRFSPWLNKFGILYGIVIAIGFISQPIYMMWFAR